MAQPDPTPSPAPETPSTPDAADRSRNRWVLLRELVVFQLKMLLEGTRDLLLVPLVLLAGVLGLAFGGDEPRRFLHDVLRAGRRFDRWLDLFAPISREPLQGSGGIDTYFEQIENVLVEQHSRGGITAQAKKTIDDALDAIEAKTGSLPPQRRRRHEP